MLKKIFYGISLTIILGCVAVLVCALNPSLTQSLAETLYGEEAEVTDGKETAEGLDTSASTESPANTEDPANTESPASDTQTSAQGDGTKEEASGTSSDISTVQGDVSGLSGYEPITGWEEEVKDSDAKELQSKLQTGATGAELNFDQFIYPYYAMLSDTQKLIYKQIYANALEGKKSFAPVTEIHYADVKDTFEAVCNDHPELFWMETSYSSKYLKDGQCIEISLQYNGLAEDLEKAEKEFNEKALEIIEPAKLLEGAEAKEKYVHDALIEKVSYNINASINQSAYAALVNGESVCAGYARAFQYIMQQLGVPCYYCTGDSGGEHAWNIIKISDNYYHVDVTWDDTEPSTYNYYNKTDAEFGATHTRKGMSVYLPACNGAGEAGTSSVTQVTDETGIEYINPNPLEPLTLPDTGEPDTSVQDGLEAAGVTEEEVMRDMEEYYTDCLKQTVQAGAGLKTFENVVPAEMWATIEKAYSDGSYKTGYANEAMKQLGVSNFSIQLQVEGLNGGYYRLYHNISTW